MAVQDLDYRFSPRKPKAEEKKSTVAAPKKGAPVQVAQPHWKAQ